MAVEIQFGLAAAGVERKNTPVPDFEIDALGAKLRRVRLARR